MRARRCYDDPVSPQFIDIEHRSFEETLARCEALGGADLLFFSPPYPTAVPGAKGAAGAPTRDYGGDAPKHFLWEDYQRLGDCCYRALKPGGFCIVIVDGPVRTIDKRKGSERSLIAFRLAIDWAERVGFRYVEHEAYLRQGQPGRFGPRRRSGWEPMHVFQRPGGDACFEPWSSTLPASTGGACWKNSKARTWSGEKAPGSASHYRRLPVKTLTTAIPASKGGAVISPSSEIDCEHPAVFSPYIAEVQILAYSKVGGLVCDPFNGSGTTGIAAAKHGRSFVGGDLGARERDGARWADVGRERALAAAANPIVAERRDGKQVPPTLPVDEQLRLI